MRNRSYYVIRGIVRGIFWAGVAVAGAYALQFLILCLWSLQF